MQKRGGSARKPLKPTKNVPIEENSPVASPLALASQLLSAEKLSVNDIDTVLRSTYSDLPPYARISLILSSVSLPSLWSRPSAVRRALEPAACAVDTIELVSSEQQSYERRQASFCALTAPPARFVLLGLSEGKIVLKVGETKQYILNGDVFAPFAPKTSPAPALTLTEAPAPPESSVIGLVLAQNKPVQLLLSNNELFGVVGAQYFKLDDAVTSAFLSVWPATACPPAPPAPITLLAEPAVSKVINECLALCDELTAEEPRNSVNFYLLSTECSAFSSNLRTLCAAAVHALNAILQSKFSDVSQVFDYMKTCDLETLLSTHDLVLVLAGCINFMQFFSTFTLPPVPRPGATFDSIITSFVDLFAVFARLFESLALIYRKSPLVFPSTPLLALALSQFSPGKTLEQAAKFVGLLDVQPPASHISNAHLLILAVQNVVFALSEMPPALSFVVPTTSTTSLMELELKELESIPENKQKLSALAEGRADFYSRVLDGHIQRNSLNMLVSSTQEKFQTMLESTSCVFSQYLMLAHGISLHLPSVLGAEDTFWPPLTPPPPPSPATATASARRSAKPVPQQASTPANRTFISLLPQNVSQLVSLLLSSNAFADLSPKTALLAPQVLAKLASMTQPASIVQSDQLTGLEVLSGRVIKPVPSLPQFEPYLLLAKELIGQATSGAPSKTKPVKQAAVVVDDVSVLSLFALVYSHVAAAEQATLLTILPLDPQFWCVNHELAIQMANVVFEVDSKRALTIVQSASSARSCTEWLHAPGVAGSFAAVCAAVSVLTTATATQDQIEQAVEVLVLKKEHVGKEQLAFSAQISSNISKFEFDSEFWSKLASVLPDCVEPALLTKMPQIQMPNYDEQNTFIQIRRILARARNTNDDTADVSRLAFMAIEKLTSDELTLAWARHELNLPSQTTTPYDDLMQFHASELAGQYSPLPPMPPLPSQHLHQTMFSQAYAAAICAACERAEWGLAREYASQLESGPLQPLCAWVSYSLAENGLAETSVPAPTSIPSLNIGKPFSAERLAAETNVTSIQRVTVSLPSRASVTLTPPTNLSLARAARARGVHVMGAGEASGAYSQVAYVSDVLARCGEFGLQDVRSAIRRAVKDLDEISDDFAVASTLAASPLPIFIPLSTTPLPMTLENITFEPQTNTVFEKLSYLELLLTIINLGIEFDLPSGRMSRSRALRDAANMTLQLARDLGDTDPRSASLLLSGQAFQDALAQEFTTCAGAVNAIAGLGIGGEVPPEVRQAIRDGNEQALNILQLFIGQHIPETTGRAEQLQQCLRGGTLEGVSIPTVTPMKYDNFNLFAI